MLETSTAPLSNYVPVLISFELRRQTESAVATG